VRITRSKLGAILAGGYLLFIAVAVIWTGVSTNAADSVDLVLTAFTLTLPWSLLAAVALDVAHTELFTSVPTTLVVLAASATINAAVLFLLGAALGTVFSGSRS